MGQLLIYHERDRRPRSLFRELAEDETLTYSYTQDLGLFESALKQQHHDACLLVLHAEPSPELHRLLSKARSLFHFGGAIALLTEPSPTAVANLLKVGVHEVFLEPVGPRRVLLAIHHHLAHLGGSAIRRGPCDELTPADCQLLSFGRIARIARDRPGELFVETGLILQPGASLTFTRELPALFGLAELSFKVDRREERNLYYNYAFGYWLSHPSDSRVLDEWPRLIAQFQGSFSTPKPKVLWVSAGRPDFAERPLVPPGVSLHHARSGTLSHAQMMRLDAQIIVVDTTDPEGLQHIERWSRTEVHTLVLSTTGTHWPHWDPNAPDAHARWEELTRPSLSLLTDRPDDDVLYPSRDAAFSRCTLSMPARLRAVGANGFDVACARGIAVDSVVELTGVPLGARENLGFYGRVDDQELIAGSDQHRLRCEAIPITDEPSYGLGRATRSIPITAASTGSMTTEGWGRSAWLIFGVIALFLAGLALASWLRPKPEVPEETMGMEALFQGLRQAFD